MDMEDHNDKKPLFHYLDISRLDYFNYINLLDFLIRLRLTKIIEVVNDVNY